jgi:hypothetical protein
VTGSGERSAAVTAFPLFVRLWCIAILFHQLFQGRFALLDGTSLLTFAALFALLEPRSLERFLVLCALHVGVVAAELPYVVNHWLLMGVTSLGLVATLAPALWRGRSGPEHEQRLETALCAVRAQIVIVYLFAVFAKLNAGFFDPAGSCGAEHYRRLADAVPLLPRAVWASQAAIAGTLAIELALPILLWIPRTRVAALALGWAFHLALGWNGYWDFSSVGAAYYAAFVQPALLTAGRRRLAPHAARLERVSRAAARPAVFALAAVVLVLPAALAAVSGRPDAEWVQLSNRAGRWLWLSYWLALGGWLALCVAGARGERAPADAAARAIPAWRRPLWWLAPALVFANGLCPYLGLKTEHSYAMFSNLRTEGAEWNHLLVPRWLRVFDFQDEPLRVRRSSDPALDRLGRAGFRLVPFELRRFHARNPQASVLLARPPAATSDLAPTLDDPRFRAPPPALLAKLLLFRPVPPARSNVCLH